MKNKTLEEYRRSFENTNEINDNAVYQKLAEKCIADYPEEDLGYERLGYILDLVTLHDDNLAKILDFYNDKIEQELPKNTKWAITLAYLLPHFDLDYIALDKWRNLLKDHKDCGRAWLAIAERYIGGYEEMAYCLNKAYQLGVDRKVVNGVSEFHDFNQPIGKITIEDFLTIESIAIDNLHDKKEIYFLGENGVGKTVLLQAIILGLINESNEITIKYANKESRINIEGFNQHISEKALVRCMILNKFAYGTSRFRTGETPDMYGYATLFDRNSLFVNPENWLKDVQRKDNLNISPIKLNTVLELLTKVINLDEDNDFKIEYDKLSDAFVFIEKNANTKFEHLADGYRSILILLCDLLERLIKNQPYIDKIEDFGGVVLIDEIDMLLHPKWEYVIVNKLTSLFPKIQWFFSTHSPMLILGATENAIFYKVYKEQGKTQVSEPYTYKQISSLLANGIITSPLFDLEYSGMREQSVKKLPEIDTNDTYLHSRINKFILEKSRELKKEKSYISPQTIDAWILDAIETHRGGHI